MEAQSGLSLAEQVEQERRAARRIVVLHEIAVNAIRVAKHAAEMEDPEAPIRRTLAVIAIRRYEREAFSYQASVES